MNALTKAAQDVLAERQRQIRAEGWTPEHDDEHAGGQMADAAAAYALEASHQVGGMMPSAPNDVPPSIWPWDEKWWKPKGARTNLVRAAALLLAEIERLDRAAGVDLPAARPPTAVEDAFLHRAVRESSKLVAPGKLADGVRVLPTPSTAEQLLVEAQRYVDPNSPLGARIRAHITGMKPEAQP